MDVIHLQIEERDNSYMLVCGEQDIKCLFSDDYVSSDKKSLIEHVRDDFDRCGELGIQVITSLFFLGDRNVAKN